MEKPILFEIENNVAIITLNRPERKNAINQELLVNLYNYLDQVIENDEIKCAIITGSENSFCAGLDLSCFETDNLFDPRGDGLDLIDIFDRCDKPLIGAINGYAITGGFELALNCDFLIASKNATFADTHSKVGIHPGWRMTQLLQQAVGQRMAKQLSLTGQFISAEKAHEVSLVNEVIPQEKLLERAKEIAGEICSVNQNIMLKVKKLIEFKNHSTFEEACKEERKDVQEFVKEIFPGLKKS